MTTNDAQLLIEDLITDAARQQSGTDVVPIRLVAEIRRRRPTWPNVLISQVIDDINDRSLGEIRPSSDDAGESEFRIDFRGVQLARDVEERRSLRGRLNRNFFPAFNAIVALVAALAAVAAAYFSYLGLPRK